LNGISRQAGTQRGEMLESEGKQTRETEPYSEGGEERRGGGIWWVSYLCGKEASYRYRGDDAMPTADLTSGRRRRTFAGDCYCFNSNPSQWWMTCRGGSEGIACGSREKAKRRGEESIAIAIAREGRGIESNTSPPSSIDSHVGSTRRRSSLTSFRTDAQYRDGNASNGRLNPARFYLYYFA